MAVLHQAAIILCIDILYIYISIYVYINRCTYIKVCIHIYIYIYNHIILYILYTKGFHIKVIITLNDHVIRRK